MKLSTTRILALTSSMAMAATLLLASPAQAGWKVDEAHSFVNFTVRHMMVTNVRGEFSGVAGTFDINEKDLTKSKIDVTIDISSVDTRNAKRDGHLKGPDFFDAAKHPKARFVATKIVKSGSSYKVTGKFTLRGVTKTLTLTAEISGPVKNPWGKVVRGIHAEGVIQRDKFGVSWNKALDKGGLLVGNDVKLSIDIELVQG